MSTPYGPWRWHRFGQGPQHVLALHGYGLSGQIFEELAKQLGADYTVWAPDLPGNGEAPLPPEVLAHTSDLFTYLPPGMSSSFLLLGHSWGGPLSLALYPSLRDRVSGILFYAPSYLLVPFPLGFMDWPLWAKKIGAWGIRYPGWIKVLSGLSARLGITTQTNHNFTKAWLSSPQERALLIACWWYWPRSSKRILRQLLAEKRLPILMVLGKKDRVLAHHRMQKGLKAYPDLEVVSLEAGHGVPAEPLSELIAHFPQTPGPASPKR